jgi:VanZ family protein/uncharacterized membrane protein (UPF0136 family)
MSRLPPVHSRPRPFLLARAALAIVGATVLYASLRPFHGWRDPGRHPFAFLAGTFEQAPGSDALLNAVGYLPLGACTVLALFPHLRAGWAFAVGAFAPTLFSLLVEAAQTYLPERVPSLVDLGMNALGACLGAALAVRCTPWLADHRGGRRLRERWLRPGHLAEMGLLVLAAWLVALLAQRTLLFGTGDFRGNLQVPVDPGVPAFVFVSTEVFVVAANLMAAGLLLHVTLAEGAPRRRWWLVLILGALGARVVSQLAFWEASAAWRWVTPASMAGVLIGALAALAAFRLPRARAALLAMALLAAAALVVNLAPPDPALWLQPTPRREHVLIGLTLVSRYVSKGWPLLAMAYLLAVWAEARPRRR